MTPLPVLSCDGCGAKCCRHLGSPPAMWPAYAAPDHDGAWLTDHEDWASWLAMPAGLREGLREYYRLALDERAIPDRVKLELPCLWLDEATGRCLGYEWRPAACREFEMGGEDCLRLRTEGGHAQV